MLHPVSSSSVQLILAGASVYSTNTRSSKYKKLLLLGEIYQANGQEIKAEQCFQEVIYLEANHYEALSHLAVH